MSDDERGSKGKGKGKGKSGKGDSRNEGGGKKGSKGGGGDRSGGPSVSRLKVVPKFIRDMQARLKPEEAKRGLDYAELKDKTSPLGHIDDDEYDVEGAQIVDSEFSLETVRAFQSKRKSAQASSAQQQEEPAGPMKFRDKSERGTSAASGASRPASAPSKGEEPSTEGRGGSVGKASADASAQRRATGRGGVRPSFANRSDDSDDGSDGRPAIGGSGASGQKASAAVAGRRPATVRARTEPSLTNRSDDSDDSADGRPRGGGGAKGRISIPTGGLTKKAPVASKRLRMSFEEDGG